MKVFIDADGCPVVSITINICKKYNIPVTIVCDTSHEFNDGYSEVITVSKGADSADFKIVSLACENDIVITQDYGLAAMCLAKKCRVLSQDGMTYSDLNIDSLLMSRHTAKKIRDSGGRLKGNPKRTKQQDIDFQNALLQLLA